MPDFNAKGHLTYVSHRGCEAPSANASIAWSPASNLTASPAARPEDAHDAVPLSAIGWASWGTGWLAHGGSMKATRPVLAFALVASLELDARISGPCVHRERRG
jgi:hypothetical protein